MEEESVMLQRLGWLTKFLWAWKQKGVCEYFAQLLISFADLRQWQLNVTHSFACLYPSQKPLDVTNHSVAREVVTFFTLPPGDYIVVPQTNIPNCDGKFLLRILTDEQSNIWWGWECHDFSMITKLRWVWLVDHVASVRKMKNSRIRWYQNWIIYFWILLQSTKGIHLYKII